MSRPIVERLAEAKARMTARKSIGWMRSTPKAFYLNTADHAEFMATKPPKISATFRNERTLEFGFDGTPVRQSTSAASRLYSEAGASAGIPVA
jgi:hypothetical protein